MNIKEFINQEVNHAKTIIQEEINNGNVENIFEYLQEVNYQIDGIVYTQLRDSVKFDLLDSNGDYYISMLGKGKQIDYRDLYEILKRLYSYHHPSQEFTIKFEEYSIKIWFDLLGELPQNNDIYRLIMSGIGNGEYLQESDFQ